MLDGMIGRPKETWESYFGERPRLSALRSFKLQLGLERKHTEKLFRGLHIAITAEMEFLEQRMMSNFEEIDVSLSLIAAELARRAEGPPPGGSGS